jgi:hypothetical protein
MSCVSGKCDFLDHLSMMKHRTKEGSDNPKDLKNASVLYSDLYECFEIFKKRTGGVVYQHKKIKEINTFNQDFIKKHCPALEIIKNSTTTVDKRFKNGIKEKESYTYKYYGKEYTAKELSKKGIYITIEIHLDTLLEAIPYFPYIVVACSSNKDKETIVLSNESYIEEHYNKMIQSGFDSSRDYYNKRLAELTRDIVLHYYNPTGREVEESLEIKEYRHCLFVEPTYKVDTD